MHYKNKKLGFSFELPNGWRHDKNIRPLTFFGPEGGLGLPTQLIQIKTGTALSQFMSPESREKFLSEPGANVVRDRLGSEENVVILVKRDDSEISAVHDRIHYIIAHSHDQETRAAIAILKKSFRFGTAEIVSSAVARQSQRKVMEVQPPLRVAVNNEMTLTLFLGAVTGAMRAGDLSREYGEYVGNIKRISALADRCHSSIQPTNKSTSYFLRIHQVSQELLESISQVPVSPHVEALQELANLYNIGYGHVDLSEHSLLKKTLLDTKHPNLHDQFVELLSAIRKQVLYINDLELKSGPSSCFIATVVYGSTEALEVQALRAYRDQKLSRHFLGRLLISLYYSGVGSALASILSTRAAFLIPPLRRVLNIPVRQTLANHGVTRERV